MGIGDLINSNNIDLGVEVAEEPSTTFADVVSSTFRSHRDNFTSVSRQTLIDEFTGKRDEAYKNATGRDIYQDAIQRLPEDQRQKAFRARSGTIDRSSRELQNAVDALVDQYRKENPESSNDIANSFGINQLAQKQAKQSLIENEKVLAGASESSRITGSLVGGLAAGFVDPVNLATIPLGAGSSMGILRTALVEAGINVAGEAAIQPLVAEWQNEIGNDYGLSDAAANVGMAALFGGGIGAIGKAISKGIARSKAHVFDEMAEKFLEKGDLDSAQSAKFMAKKAHLDESDIAQINDNVSWVAHKKAADEVNASILNGRNINEAELKIRDQDILDLEPKRASSEASAKVIRAIQGEADVAPQAVTTKQMNEVLDFERPVPPDLERQAELGRIFDSNESKLSELNDFNEKFNDTDEILFGDNELEDIRIEDLKQEFAGNDSVIEAINTCRV